MKLEVVSSGVRALLKCAANKQLLSVTKDLTT